jgi:hypothetical protein
LHLTVAERAALREIATMRATFRTRVERVARQHGVRAPRLFELVAGRTPTQIRTMIRRDGLP